MKMMTPHTIRRITIGMTIASVKYCLVLAAAIITSTASSSFSQMNYLKSPQLLFELTIDCEKSLQKVKLAPDSNQYALETFPIWLDILVVLRG